MNKYIKKLFRLRDKDDSRVKFHIDDQVTLPSESTRILTPEGYLKATAAITKVGVQVYPARQFGIDSDEVVGLLRTRETVFHPETIESVKMKPIVLLHPEEDVDSENVSRLSIGTVGETVEEIADERLGAAIQITDAGVVKKILAREVDNLSLGYDLFTIPEKGSFGGLDYSFKSDGPMINNHLAIVPKGRCGDTVKILDKGAETVDKLKAIQRLRDAGVPEDQIKLFMANAKDTDPVDFEEYTKILLGAKDIDMAALIPGIIAELKPTIEKMVASPEFSAQLAKEVAATLGAAPPAGEEIPDADADPNADPAAADPDPAAQDAKIQDAARMRSEFLDMASPFLKKNESFDRYKATDNEILVEALTNAGVKPETIKGRDDNYLSGMLTLISKDRQDVDTAASKVMDSSSPEALSAPLTGIEAQKKLR